MNEPEQSFEFRGTLTEQQYRRIQWLASRKLILGFGLFLVVMIAMNLSTGGARVIARDPVIQLARLAPFILFLPVLFFMPRWQARRQFRANAALQGELTGRVTESGLEYATVVGQARYRWDQILKAKTSSDLALVFTSPQIALYLPRFFFATEEAWAGALGIIRSKVAKVKHI